MTAPGVSPRIVLASRPVDFRKQIDALAGVVENELGLDPYSGVAVVFRCEDELRLALDELEGALAEAEEAAPASAERAQRPKRSAPKRNLGHLPEHLHRIEQVIEPESTHCPCGCGEVVRIGKDRTERLDIVPAQLRVIVTVRPKYACRTCEQGVTQAPAPAHLIEGAMPSEGAIAHVLVSKYADHCPLYRQVQIYARSGLDLDRSTLAGKVRQGLVPPQADGRSAGRTPQAIRQAVHGRDPGAGSRPRPGQHQDRVAVGAGARRPQLMRRRAAAGNTPSASSAASKASCRSTATSVAPGSPERGKV